MQVLKLRPWDVFVLTWSLLGTRHTAHSSTVGHNQTVISEHPYRLRGCDEVVHHADDLRRIPLCLLFAVK